MFLYTPLSTFVSQEFVKFLGSPSTTTPIYYNNVYEWGHDTQPIGTWHNDIQHKDTQHKGLIFDPQHK